MMPIEAWSVIGDVAHNEPLLFIIGLLLLIVFLGPQIIQAYLFLGIKDALKDVTAQLQHFRDEIHDINKTVIEILQDKRTQ